LFADFCKNNSYRFLETIKINKNLLQEMDNPKENMYVIGSSEPKDKKGLILSGIMKYSSLEIIDFEKYDKDQKAFLHAQRFPLAIAK
jgi:hypothetical protein